MIFIQIYEKSINDLKFYDKNPRKNDPAVDAVAASIETFGWRVPVVVDSNNVIIAGHTRVKAAKKLKISTIPCVVVDDLTDEQIRAYRLTDNKTSELSLWDFDLLNEELSNIFDIDMSAFGFDLSESVLPDPLTASDDLGDNINLDKEFKYKCPACGYEYN